MDVVVVEVAVAGGHVPPTGRTVEGDEPPLPLPLPLPLPEPVPLVGLEPTLLLSPFPFPFPFPFPLPEPCVGLDSTLELV